MIDAARLDATFHALSDPTRRAILARLAAEGDITVMDLAEPFEMSQPAISKHLKVLEKAQRRPVHLEAQPLAEATGWLIEYRQYWAAQFGRLDDLLGELQRLEAASGKT